MKKKIFTTLFLVLVSVNLAYAVDPYLLYQQYEFPETASDAVNNNTSGTTSEKVATTPDVSIVTMDGKLAEAPVKSISVEAVISDNIQTYDIPLSYGFPLSLTGNKELLNLKLVIPYTRRELGGMKDSGLGDISFTGNYLIRFPQLLLDSKLVVKAPTGEVEDSDVPLGTGSTDVGLYVNATWYFKGFSLKGGLGYGYNGDYDIMGASIDNGDQYLVSAGGDYNINESMRVGAVLVYQSIGETEEELPNGGGLLYVPGINTLDLIPTFTYYYAPYNVELNTSILIPVTDSWNTDKGVDPMDDPDRSVKFSVSVSKPF